MFRFVLAMIAIAYVCPDMQSLTALSAGIGRLTMITDQMRAHGEPDAAVATFTAEQMKEGFDKTKCSVEYQPDREGA